MTGRLTGIVVVLGLFGWIGLVSIAVQLYGTDPPTAGFDLELLLQAGRDVAAGRSPYDPAIVAGTAPIAEQLFYSYPPVVAQAMTVFAAIPSAIVFPAWVLGAVAGLALITAALSRRLAPELHAGRIALVATALVPLMFPFAVGLLFGNLDVYFPLLYGAMLLAVLESSGPRAGMTGGVAAAAAGLAKLHPGTVLVSVAVAGIHSYPSRRAAFVAVAVGLTTVACSVALGGGQLWSDFFAVVRAGSGADVVDPRNAGPAAQLSLLLGPGGARSEALARMLQPVITLFAFGLTVVTSWRLRDPIERLAWAAAASLIVLPVTWFHYPSALIPFAIAAVLRAHRSRSAAQVFTLVAGSVAAAAAAIALLPLLYVAIGLILLAVRQSAARPASSLTSLHARGHGVPG